MVHRAEMKKYSLMMTSSVSALAKALTAETKKTNSHDDYICWWIGDGSKV